MASSSTHQAFSILRSTTNTTTTDQVTLYKDNPAFDKAKAPPEFKIDGQLYHRKGEVARNTKRRAQPSKAWQFGEILVRVSDRKEVYYCYDCEVSKRKQQLPILSGTKAALYHMEHVHKRDPETGDVRTIPGAKQEVFTLVKQSSFDTFKLLLLRWFVFCQMALFMLENLYFRELIKYLNIGLSGLLPKSAKTLRNWIMEEYENQQKTVAAELSSSLSRIHITFDIWTAGNFVGFLSIWAY
jgi:hypothetical protein